MKRRNEECLLTVHAPWQAGGVGLNLTAANHVIHFDRWYNPSVENQATDRVFRIGQTKTVFVHKLICEGTFEEKINLMIEKKKVLFTNIASSDIEPLGAVTALCDALQQVTRETYEARHGGSGVCSHVPTTVLICSTRWSCTDPLWTDPPHHPPPTTATVGLDGHRRGELDQRPDPGGAERALHAGPWLR